MLAKKGDDLRIDWGYVYVGVAQEAHATQNTSKGVGRSLMLNTQVDLGKVGSASKEQVFLVGYDDLEAIQYFGTNLKAWWQNESGQSIEKVLHEALTDYASILAKCDAFDKQIYSDAEQAGGKNYADLCALAYRQSVSAHKVVKSPQGEILFLSKENFSNGCINTVDVTYPSAPLYLLYNPVLVKVS